MAAMRPQQSLGFLDQFDESLRPSLTLAVTAKVEEPSQVAFNPRELTPGHIERLAIAAIAAAGVELHCQFRSGDRVPKLMSQPAGNLTEQTEALAFCHAFVQSLKACGHIVDGFAEIAQFVVAFGQGHW